MSQQNPVVIQQQPVQAQGLTRDEMSQQIAQGEWSNLASQIPQNERIVIKQDTQNVYTIERQQLPDPTQQLAKPPINWSGIALAVAVLFSAVFAYSIYKQHGG